jgi:hypothetical protein
MQQELSTLKHYLQAVPFHPHICTCLRVKMAFLPSPAPALTIDPPPPLLYQVGFTMQQELSTLKHYLKVVPFHHHHLGGEVTQAYRYKANYNEYRPRKLEWYEVRVSLSESPEALFFYLTTDGPTRAERKPPPAAGTGQAQISFGL